MFWRETRQETAARPSSAGAGTAAESAAGLAQTDPVGLGCRRDQAGRFGGLPCPPPDSVAAPGALGAAGVHAGTNATNGAHAAWWGGKPTCRTRVARRRYGSRGCQGSWCAGRQTVPRCRSMLPGSRRGCGRPGSGSGRVDRSIAPAERDQHEGGGGGEGRRHRDEHHPAGGWVPPARRLGLRLHASAAFDAQGVARVEGSAASRAGGVHAPHSLSRFPPSVHRAGMVHGGSRKLVRRNVA